jgi:hypothetical protein
VDTYFKKTNVYLPVFHRPTFEKALASGTHLRDEGFGAVVLLLCANAADPPIPPVTDLSPYFRQVQNSGRSILGPARLYDVQLHFVIRFLPRIVATLTCLIADLPLFDWGLPA